MSESTGSTRRETPGTSLPLLPLALLKHRRGGTGLRTLQPIRKVPRVPWRPLTPSSWCSGKRRDGESTRCTDQSVSSLGGRGGASGNWRQACFLGNDPSPPRRGKGEIRRNSEPRGPGGLGVGAPVWGSGVRGGGFETQEPR